MSSSTSVVDQPFHVRSTSMPSRPQPIVLKVEEVLKDLKTSLDSSTSVTPVKINNRLSELGNLYESIEMILQLRSNQQALSDNHNKKWMENELEQSIQVLDLCTIMRDNLVVVKDHAQELSFALRRKDALTESKLKAYTCSWKKAHKDAKNCFKSLKKIQDKDCDLEMVIKTLIEAREITIALLQSVFSTLSMPTTEAKGWSLSLKKKKVACVDDELIYAKHVESLEQLENGLDCLCRHLILNRVSLLNIISF